MKKKLPSSKSSSARKTKTIEAEAVAESPESQGTSTPRSVTAHGHGQSTSAAELGLKEARLCLQDIGQILEFMCKYCMKPILLAQLRTHQLLEHPELLNDQRQEEKQVPEAVTAKKTDERIQKSQKKVREHETKNSTPKKRKKELSTEPVLQEDETEARGVLERAVPSTSSSKKAVGGGRGANEETRRCGACSRPIPVSLFAEHLLTHCEHPTGKVWNCNLCEYTSRASRELKDHLMAKHYRLKGHICPNCSATFSWLRGLEEHSNICKRSSELHKCEDCSRRFLNSKQLASHKLIHVAPKDGRVIQCKVCSKSFETPEFIQHLDSTHLKNCTEKMGNKKYSYNCPMPLCRYQTWTHYVLREHVAYKHHGVKPYTCEKCKAVFTTMNCFRTHKKNPCAASDTEVVEVIDGAGQDTAEQIHTCETCCRPIPASLFVEHLVTHCHHSVGNFECSLCKYSSSSSRHLKDHLTSQHYGMKRHVCPNCSKEFSWLKGLKSHFRMCKKMSLHKCAICSKQFLNSKQLAGHQQVHLAPRDERVIQCMICTEKLGSSEEFIKHLDESHLRNQCGEKIENKYLYNCPMPDCAYQIWGNFIMLREHVAYKHHGVKPYACDKCKEGFISMKRYRTHKKHPCSAKKPGPRRAQKLTRPPPNTPEPGESSDSENSDTDYE